MRFFVVQGMRNIWSDFIYGEGDVCEVRGSLLCNFSKTHVHLNLLSICRILLLFIESCVLICFSCTNLGQVI